MNKFKKKTRSKMIAASIAILSSAAVISTGFAAWVISGGDTKEVGGTIEADEVSSKAHTLSAIAFDANADKISFGAPKDKDTISKPYNWLQNNETNENLIASATFTVSNVDAKPDNLKELFDEKECKFEETTATKVYVETSDAVKNKYVGAFPAWNLNQQYANQTAPGVYLQLGELKQTTLTVTLKVVFAWGDTFQNQNPFVHYNAQKKTPSLESEATTALTAIRALNKAKFKVTVATK